MALGVRDDPHDKAFWENISDCEADSVESDRTFACYILCKPGRQLDFQSEIRAFLLEANNARHAVDMALYEMSAQPSLDRESALQIHAIASAKIFEVRASDCFLEMIES